MSRKRIPDSIIHGMHAEYIAGASLSEIGRRYKRDRRSIAELFTTRGLALRPSSNAQKPRRKDGTFVPDPALTEAEIDALIAAATKITVPPVLKLEWRKWPMSRRRDFIARIRRKLARAEDRPETPFSSNVEPFDYGSPNATAIEAQLNQGKNSQTKVIKIKPCSQGVIYQGQLWFWSHKVGYQRGTKWTPEEGRPVLHVVIWEQATGRSVPPSCVIRHRDGNRNNLNPENLVLESRDDLCRQNQATHLLTKSREMTNLLLSRHSTQKSNASIHSIIPRRQS